MSNDDTVLNPTIDGIDPDDLDPNNPDDAATIRDLYNQQSAASRDEERGLVTATGKTPSEILEDQRQQSEDSGELPERHYTDKPTYQAFRDRDVTLRGIERAIPERVGDEMVRRQQNVEDMLRVLQGEDAADASSTSYAMDTDPILFPARKAIIERRDGKQGYEVEEFRGRGIVENGVLLYNPDGTPFEYIPEIQATQYRFSLTVDKLLELEARFEARGLEINTYEDIDNAIKALMYEANAAGISWQEYLVNVEAIAPLLEDKQSAPLFTATSSVDVQDIANRAAMATIGRNFTQTELAQFTNDYYESQRKFAQQNQTQESGLIEQPPSIQGAATEFAEEVDPSRANAYRFLDKFRVLERVIRGGMA